MTARLPFYSSCVDWDRGDVPALTAMIDAAEPITRRTFLRHVDREHLRAAETRCGYVQHPRQGHGLTMAGDWHVGYFRSRLHGHTVYGFRWSAIEHVFAAR